MAMAHGFMTLIADEGRLRDVVINHPTGGCQWVVHLLAYPCETSIHLDRKGLELLAERIDQALQDHDSCMSGPHDNHKRSPGADDEEADGEASSTVCPWLLKKEADGDGVDLDDPALTSGPEEERKP